MRKFLTFIAGVLIVAMASAQTVQRSKFFENWYVTPYGGATTTVHGEAPFIWDGAKTVFNGVRPIAGLELGKYITPVVGWGVEGIADFNTTGSYTLVDQSAVLLNGKLNLSNWFGGYPGEPRVFETVLVGGLGWGHDYGEPIVDPNYVVYKTGVEFNFNLGKAKAWQINVRPAVLWNNYDNCPKFNWDTDARVTLGLGVTYKFGSRSKKSHNFVLCPYSVTQEDYDTLKSEYEALLRKKQEVKTVEVVKVEKQVVKEEVFVDVPASVTIYFDKGKYDISERELAHLDFYGSSVENTNKVTITVTGSADTGTGSLERNNFLAQKRAEAVRDVLVSKYGFDPEKIDIRVLLDIFDNPARSRVVVVE